MRDEAVTLEDLTLLFETSKAYLLQPDQGERFWMPKSQVLEISFGDRCVVDGQEAMKVESLTIPEWVAREKALD